MGYPTWQEALAGMVHEAALEPSSELARLSRAASRLSSENPSERGYPDSSGTAGAPGHSMRDSETRDPPRTAASTTPDDGSKRFPVRLTAISLQSKGESRDAYTLTVWLSSRTAARLKDHLFGDHGTGNLAGVECCLTVPNSEPPST